MKAEKQSSGCPFHRLFNSEGATSMDRVAEDHEPAADATPSCGLKLPGPAQQRTLGLPNKQVEVKP